MNRPTVGLIANPASGKDIRRLVAHGTVVDNQGKVSIVRRLVISLMTCGVGRILYMPDYFGLMHKAVDGLGSNYSFKDGLLKNAQAPGPGIKIEQADVELTGSQNDSRTAAEAIARQGAKCILVLGGDGTCRQAAKGSGQVPLLPISSGTNNVFPSMVEATTAGLAAAAVALDLAGPQAVYQAKRLTIEKNGQKVDEALVDAVVTRGSFTGSKAVWDVSDLAQAVFTRGEPGDMGLASIIGKTNPVSPKDSFGAYVVFDPRRRDLMAPIAPGVIKAVGVTDSGRLYVGEHIDISVSPAVIALDGEREVEISENDKVSISLSSQGPFVVDLEAALAGSVALGFYRDAQRLAELG
ncbi:MAG: NAD(+)/NADH kinase [Deltaproteobacteria bacterium]|nr:NAD(+)/NADH kinase [Deltaproteobacteria bacterium]